MAYARLSFSAGTTVYQKLKDIAKFCSGQISTQNDLEFAQKTLSDIVVTDKAGWTALTTFETAGTSSLSEYILSSKCLNENKTKYAALRMTSAFTASTAQTTNISAPAVNSTTGFLFIPISTELLGNKLKSPCFYVNALHGQGVLTFNVYARVDMSANTFYISCSNRKIFILSESTINSFASVLEFPETAHTRINNLVPFINLTASNIGSAAVNGYADVQTGYVMKTTSSTVEINSVICSPNWYSRSDGLTKNRLLDDGFQQESVLIQPFATINKDSQSVVFTPIIDIRTMNGENIHYYSSLTDIYFVSRSPTLVANGVRTKFNNDTYVILNSGTSIANYKSIAIKRS